MAKGCGWESNPQPLREDCSLLYPSFEFFGGGMISFLHHWIILLSAGMDVFKSLSCGSHTWHFNKTSRPCAIIPCTERLMQCCHYWTSAAGADVGQWWILMMPFVKFALNSEAKRRSSRAIYRDQQPCLLTITRSLARVPWQSPSRTHHTKIPQYNYENTLPKAYMVQCDIIYSMFRAIQLNPRDFLFECETAFMLSFVIGQ